MASNARDCWFDFFERLREGRVDFTGKSLEDIELVNSAISMSTNIPLRDAVFMKIIEPTLDRTRFDLVALNNPQCIQIVTPILEKAWESSAYNVREQLSMHYHQDIPALCDVIAAQVLPVSARDALYEISAYASWLQGDDEVSVQAHVDRIAQAQPLVSQHDWSIYAMLGVVLEQHIQPAWVLSARRSVLGQVIPALVTLDKD